MPDVIVKKVILEMSVGALHLKVSSRDIPENTMADGRVMGILEAAHVTHTLPLLQAFLTGAVKDALRSWSDHMDALAEEINQTNPQKKEEKP